MGELQELKQPVTAGDLVGFAYVNMDQLYKIIGPILGGFGRLSGSFGGIRIGNPR